MNRRFRESLIAQYCNEDKPTNPMPLTLIGAGLFLVLVISMIWLVFPSRAIGQEMSGKIEKSSQAADTNVLPKLIIPPGR